MKRCPTGTEVQSVIFNRDTWTARNARSWLAKNKLKTPKTDTKKNTLRYRQHSKAKYKKGSFRNIPFGDAKVTGIQAVIGCPKKTKNPGSVILAINPIQKGQKKGKTMANRARNKKGQFKKGGGGGGGGRKRGKTKTIIKYRTRNPAKKSRGGRAATYGKRTLAGINIGAAFKATFPLLLGALAAKFAAKKFTEGGADDQNWTWKNYGFGLLGGFIAAVASSAIFKSRGNTAQRVMEGAFLLIGYKIFINEIAAEHDTLESWFGEDEDYYPQDTQAGANEGDVYQARDGENYVMGSDGYWRPVSEAHRTPLVGDGGMGQEVMPVDPTMGSEVFPVDPTMGDPVLDEFNKAYPTAA